MTWRPYQFEDVPFYTSSQARACTELASLVPDEHAALRMRRAVGRVVADLQGKPKVGSEGTDARETQSAEEWLSIRYAGPAGRDTWHGGDHVVRIQIGLGSQELRAITEIPLPTVRSLIGRIVEVPAARLGASDLITPVEEGILSFFAERIIAALAERVTTLEPLLPLSVLDCSSGQGELRWGDEGIEGWFSLAGSVPLDGMNVPFRTLVPWKAMRNLRQRHEASADYTLRRDRNVQRMLRPFANSPVELTGRLGVATLESEELARLEPTDILLFDSDELTIGSAPANELGGAIELAHFGWDRSLGAIRGTLADDGRQLRFQVEEHILPARYATQEANLSSPSIPPSSGDPETTAINADSTAPGSQVSGQKLVEGSPVQLRIEIGRLKMTLRELSEIGAGQILNLHRATSDPVTLMVDDRVIGRGELVQVEGELGVRVSSLGPS